MSSRHRYCLLRVQSWCPHARRGFFSPSKSILYISKNKNPPETTIEFFKEQKNLERINCFSDEGDKWDKSKVILDKNKLHIKFRDKFNFRRGRINCSLNDDIGWRWLGIQFSIEQN